MRSSTLRIAFATFASLMVTGTAFGQKATYDYDRATNFAPFKTYKWVSDDGAKHPDAITAGSITTIIDGLLAAKGFVKKDADPVDLFIGYGTTAQDQQIITGYGGGMGYRFGGGMGMAETSTIQNGAILLDVYNPKGKLLVWRGTVTETLDPSSNPDKKFKKLEKALAKLLKNFPPPVKK